MLDLGGIPLRVGGSRRGRSRSVIAGGPTATHPEPLAPFLDAVVIGDGEEKATEVALTLDAACKREGVPRRERLVAIAQPRRRLRALALRDRASTPTPASRSSDRPLVAGLPFPIDRARSSTSTGTRSPTTSPTGGPEAIFDRMSIEIARGCTEGCRFCQAGHDLPAGARARSRADRRRRVMRAVKKSGQDEVSLTALSTADVLVHLAAHQEGDRKLAPEERMSLGVSSLRAYGLEPDLLDDIKRVRATGLTFAPEAGTQRMRDVVNKNVTEEQLLETAERVFSRGLGQDEALLHDRPADRDRRGRARHRRDGRPRGRRREEWRRARAGRST